MRSFKARQDRQGRILGKLHIYMEILGDLGGTWRSWRAIKTVPSVPYRIAKKLPYSQAFTKTIL
jgi:hypothetical protein